MIFYKMLFKRPVVYITYEYAKKNFTLKLMMKKTVSVYRKVME